MNWYLHAERRSNAELLLDYRLLLLLQLIVLLTHFDVLVVAAPDLFLFFVCVLSFTVALVLLLLLNLLHHDSERVFHLQDPERLLFDAAVLGLLCLILVLAQMGKVPHWIIDFYPLVLLATNITFVFLVFAGDK